MITLDRETSHYKKLVAQKFGELVYNGLWFTPLREALSRPVEEWDGILVNDFEETVFAKYPELAAIKRSLYDSGAVYASMSGSGSALFALFKA